MCILATFIQNFYMPNNVAFLYVFFKKAFSYTANEELLQLYQIKRANIPFKILPSRMKSFNTGGLVNPLPTIMLCRYKNSWHWFRPPKKNITTRHICVLRHNRRGFLNQGYEAKAN